MKIFPAFAILLLSFTMNLPAQLKISTALLENKINPRGVALQQLHFNWELQSVENNQYQTGYQLVLASSAEKLASGTYDVYNSLRVKSRQSIMINYEGKPLQPAKTYYWRIKVWDKNNRPSAWSSVQEFTTGLFAVSDWANAKWIGYEALPDSMRVVPGIHQPLANTLGIKCMQRSTIPLFRKQFGIAKKVKTALLFVTGLGQYQISINQQKIGNSFLSPGWTQYDKTVLYNTYDVTRFLLDGQNTIGALVGNGFYNINRERYFKIVTAYGNPTMICRLKIVYDDDSTENIVTDESWKTTASPITFSSIYGGEAYDAQLEQRGWNSNNFNDVHWKNALLIKAPSGQLMPEQDYPVVLQESFSPKTIQSTAGGTYLYDFGQNISGIIQLKIKGKKGQTIQLVPAELLKADQSPNQDASGAPFYFSYTLKGDEEESWQPAFTYYGFRYVQVSGAVPADKNEDTDLPIITQLTSLHNRNSNPENGSFECSNQLFNRIDTLIKWAIKSNMQSVITDCPHREKLSWLEQDYLMGASIHYNYDVHSLYRKLVQDLADAQYTEGFVPDIAPEYVVFYGGFLDSPEWGSSAVILPWLLYSWYGDKATLQKAYPMMKKYVAYLESKSDHHILSHGLGDWFDYGPNEPGEAQLTPKAVTATSIYYYDVALLSKMAAALGFNQDAFNFKKQALTIKTAFNKRFFNDATKVYATGSQTAMAMPLGVGLVNDENKKAVMQNLVDSIHAGNNALTAGDIGFHFLVQALDEGGASQLIFDMNNRDDVPGYGFQLKKGATALTESWPALENVSNNHLMLGHIMEWFYSGLAGISQEDNSIAFNHIKIRPQPVRNITHAKGSFHSPYGWIRTSWQKTATDFSMDVQIPVNTTAMVYVPKTAQSTIFINGKRPGNITVKNGVAIMQVGSGSWHFEVRHS